MHPAAPSVLTSSPDDVSIVDWKFYRYADGVFLKMGPQLLKEQLTVGQQGQVCVLCKRSTDDEALYGKLYTCGSVTAHYYCLLFSSGLGQRGKDGEGILGFLEKDIEKEVQRGRKLSSTACTQTGATVGCCNWKCTKTYHFPCGVEHRMVN